ncbi:MAG: hypothetical protein ACR9NN_06205 [Nostochopsis sp.]
MQNPQKIQVGNVVLILYPEYVAGKKGVVCAQEVIINKKMSDRWIIQIESENIVVSLNPNEFKLTEERQRAEGCGRRAAFKDRQKE